MAATGIEMSSKPADDMRKTAQPIDIETEAGGAYDSHSYNKGDDARSEEFQGGVQRVRAITEIWSKKTLICMFVLYASSQILLRQIVSKLIEPWL